MRDRRIAVTCLLVLLVTALLLPGRAMAAGERTVRLVGASVLRGAIATVCVQLDAQGDENAVGFTVNFDPALLTYQEAHLGSDATDDMLMLNTGDLPNGHVGAALALSPGQTFAPGTLTLLEITFHAALTTDTITTPLSFDNSLIVCGVSDAMAKDLTTTFTNDAVRIATPLSAISLTAAPVSPQLVTTPITLSAHAIGGVNVEYQFRAGYQDAAGWHWSILRDYGASPTYNWMPNVTHLYTLVVWARELGSTTQYQVYGSLNYTIRLSLSAVSLTAAPPSPSVVNMPVTLTATPTGGVNIEYKFRCGYQDIAGWHWSDLDVYCATRTCAWSPAEPRTYTLVVYAREQGSAKAYDVYTTYVYRISPQPLTAVALAAVPLAPQVVKTPITLTTTPTGGWKVEYKFRAGYQDAAGWHWSDVQGYGTAQTCTWTPADAHLYTLVVWAREVGHTSTYDVTKTLSYRITP